MIPATVSPDVAPCLCVEGHRPTPTVNHWHHVWPLGWGGPDSRANVLALCPTGHVVVHRVMDNWKKAGIPSGPGRMNHYLYGVALDGWNRWEAASRGVSIDVG